ncbi:substrate-binding domain-containing protein [Actinospica sp. MGRD01-02]|uniref:Substrate-binding domain-containing protein n=1 Tax=Actinospica acidithermotolerans TaxID=2828514 RepID=A0A941EAR4_9ACTN|nr:substrate-binding domain-containing protein [Actinospica acidithermotolerans]MBR7827762.1 substrate-binding domain-containing protein [Actinospica acidithermotolerans]
MRIKRHQTAVAATALIIALTAAGCSKSSGSTTSASSSTTAAAVTLTGNVSFNDANLTALDTKIAAALKGKSLSGVNIAMVVNVAADYWNAGKTGFQAGCTALGISSSNCIFYAPPNGTLTEQDSELESLRGKGITGYSISAIDPASAKSAIATDVSKGIFVLAIDSPLPGTAAQGLYLGTPNEQAGYQAGEAMKTELGGKGNVAILVGSLTAANATERIAGFKQALAGTSINVTVTENDNLSASTAQSDAETILANHPDIKGLYGVYSYDGPALAKAVTTAGKTGQIAIVSDDTDPATLSAVQSGTIAATVAQMPYYQGYTGAYILAAEKVLGSDATMAIVKPYLESDGTTLSSGVGVITKSDYSQYTSLETQLGIG